MQTLLSNAPGLLKMSVQASVLIVLVLAVQWCCGRRLQPRWRCALWLLVLLRLALPWTVPSPVSLFNLEKLPMVAPYATAGNPSVQAVGVSVSGAAAGTPVTASASTERHWLVWLWAAGVLCLAGYAAINHYKLHRRITRWRPLTDGPTLSLLEDCKALMGVRTPVTLIETEAITSPMLFGFVRPRLLLPAGLRSGFTQDELRHIFLHELAHIKRHDILAGWIALGLQAIHWFNPLVWLAFHRLRVDREMACDALALSCTRAGENEAYGLTIVKLLEGFSKSDWAPSLAGVLENKQQMKERIRMIAKFHKSNRGLALAISVFAGLALVTLTDAQTGGNTGANAKGAGGNTWDLQQKLKQADAGNQWAVFDVWDAYAHGNHGIQPDATEANKWLGKLVKDVSVVRFEPVGDFAPTDAGEFLDRIHKYSPSRSGRNSIGEASFFRTTKQGDKLVGSFLSTSPDQLKANLSKVPGLKITSVEQITPEKFVVYEESEQESLWSLQQKMKQAEAGNQWAVYDLWDAYQRGNHGVQSDSAQAKKWLEKFVQDVWVVRFEPVDDFAPANPGDFLGRIDKYAKTYSGRNNIGAASFFRTTKQGNKLVGSFLSNYPDQLKAGLAKVPGVKVTSTERITGEEFIKYEQSPQESL